MNIVYYIHDVTSPEEFEQTLHFLRNRFRFISSNDLRDFLNHRISLENTCLLTMDDGWISSYRYIFPILQKQGIPAVLFVSPDVCEQKLNFWFSLLRFCDETQVKNRLIDKKLYHSKIMGYPLDLLLKGLPADTIYEVLSEYLADKKQTIPRCFINTQEVLEMQASGLVEIGAHTLSHPILSLESDERAEREIVDSVCRLSNLLGRPVRSFAYPNGLPQLDFGAREMLILQKTEVDLAFSVAPAPVKHDTDKLSIPRIGSLNRLLLGPLGVHLPSLSNQSGIRKRIARFLL